MLKKQFRLHLDALIVIALLFVVSIGLNAIQYFNYKALLNENFGLQMQGLTDQLNLDSQQNYIDRLKQECLTEEQLDASQG